MSLLLVRQSGALCGQSAHRRKVVPETHQSADVAAVGGSRGARRDRAIDDAHCRKRSLGQDGRIKHKETRIVRGGDSRLD